jgi:hypothetical protein
VPGLGDRLPAAGVRGDRLSVSGGAASVRQERFRGPEVRARRAVVAAGAGQRGQLGRGAEAVGAQPDPELRHLAQACPFESPAHGVCGVRPAALGQGELRDVGGMDRRVRVFAHAGRYGLEAGARGVEVAATGVERGTERQQVVRVVRGHGAERRRADGVRLLPFADRDQSLGLVADERRAIDPVAP